jgi:GT2 family glycosyltransferase
VPNRWFNPWLFRQRYAVDHPALATMHDYAAFEFYVENAAEFRFSPSGLFDEAGYVERYPDAAALVQSGEFRSGFHHFVGIGWAEGRTNLFAFGEGILEPKQIGREQRDYVLHAPDDLRRIVWWFDELFYLSVYPDIHALQRRGAIRSGLEHFLAFGLPEGRVPHPAVPPAPNGDREAFFSTLAQQGAVGPVSLAEASALARRISVQGWNANLRAISDAIWPFVAAPHLDGTCDAAQYLAANPDLSAAFGNDEAAAAAHWRQTGIAEQRLAPGSAVFTGRQLLLEDVLRGNSGVNFFGPLTLASGLGTAARGYVSALRQAGVEVDTYDVSGFVRPGAGYDLFAAEDLRFSINLIFLNAEQVLPFAARYGTEVFARRANVGFWVWELPTPRPEWRAALPGLDLIVTPSAYCRDSFATFTGRAVELLPYVVDRDALIAARDAYAGGNAWIERLAAERAAGKRIILFVMDASSYTERKGLDVFHALAGMFDRAYPGRVLFVLKTHSRAANAAPVDTLSSSVLVIDAVFDLPALCKLKSMADVYISPHRSEGFGLNIFESVLLGVPTFCSDHAGAVDLLGPSYPYLLPGRLAEVGADRGPYRRGAVWFAPDPQASFEKLVQFFDAPEAGREAFDAAAARLARELSAAAVGQRLGDMLRQRLGLGLDLSTIIATLSGARERDGFTVAIPAPIANQPERMREALTAAISPMFSIVTPTFNTRPEWLFELHEDLCSQTEASWEWCVYDDGSTDPRTRQALAELRQRDPRVRVRFGSANRGIAHATNAAAELSCGAYLVMVDHDDRVSPELLQSYRLEIARHPDCPALYCDEDKLIPDGSRSNHFYKPDFSPEYIISTMYVLHCLCVRKSLFLELGGYRPEYDGAQDHDFVLRLHSSAVPIRHVDKLLYHWRMTEGSAAASSDAKRYAIEMGRRAVADYAYRAGLDATVEHGLAPGLYRVRPRISPGRVSLNILTACTAGRIGDRLEVYAEHFVRSIIGFDYGLDYEIRVIVDADRIEAAHTLPLLDERVTLVPYNRGDAPFNFAAKANFAIQSTDADRVILLNDDMEALDKDWLGAALELLEIPGVGIAGGRLLYADDTVQHCGIVLGVLGASTHVLTHLSKREVGYNAFSHTIRNYSAVTGAFMAFRKSLFMRLGGFDESYPIDFNDIDFCLRAQEAGYRVVYTPFAQLRHFESRSARRNKPDSLDTRRFTQRWESLIRRDPYYNLNLRRDTAHYKAIGEE